MTLGLVCDACDTLSQLSATVCPVCNSPLGVGGRGPQGAAPQAARHCPSCQSEVPREHRFCGVCGLRVETGDARPTWASTQGARSWADLPAAAIKYVRRIEELIECPVALLSTSPERDDTILVTDPFAD